MNEAIASRALPRRWEVISATLDSYRRERDWLMKLAGECAALDIRPLIWDGAHLTPVREIALPDALREALQNNAQKIAELQMELREAYERYVAERDYGLGLAR